MGFLDIFRPKWRHSDFETRMNAVRDLADDDTKTLLSVATSDTDVRIRRVAVKKLYDPAALRQIAGSETDEQLRTQAADRADDLLITAACARGEGDGSGPKPLEAVALIEDARALATVIKKAAREDVRHAALAKLADGKLLVEIVLKNDDALLRESALEKIGDGALLTQIARESDKKDVALAALERVSDVRALGVIAANARVKAVRQAAEARLPEEAPAETGKGERRGAAPGKKKAAAAAAGPSPAEVKKLKQRLLQVCLFVEPFCRSGSDWALCEAKIAEAEARWAEIGDVPGAEALEERFAAAKKQYQERKAQALHEAELRAQKAKEAREAEERKRREAAEAAARAEAAASQAQAAEADRAAADERRRAEREDKAVKAAAASLEEQLAALVTRAEKLAARDRVPLDRLDELEAEWKKLDPTDDRASVAVAWAEEPSAPVDPVSASSLDAGWDTPEPAPAPSAPAPAPAAPADQHTAARKAFFAAITAGRAKAAEALEKVAAERAAAVAELVKHAERLEKLAESEDLKKLDGALKNARSALKALRPSPDPDDKAARERLGKAMEVATARAGALKDAEGWRRWANLPKFEQLIKEAEALLEIADTVDDAHKRNLPDVLRELQQRWKAAGALPQEQSKALWERFKKACDALYEKSRAYFGKLEADRPGNLEKKLALCVKAEELAESSDWKATSDALKALQEEWKTIGPVPDEQKDEVWKRFRGALDKFYARRAEHDQSRDAERAEAVAKKEQLIAEAERLSRSTEWRETAEALKALQEDWKQSGHVPRAAGEELWKRFRAACDAFFAARSAAFQEQDAERADNLAKKLELIAQAEALAALEDRDEAMDKAKELQRTWKTIGHVPREQADEIWSRFRAACDVVFEERDEPEALPPPPEPAEGLGIGGFVNRLPLAGIAEKLAKKDEASDEEEKKPE